MVFELDSGEIAGLRGGWPAQHGSVPAGEPRCCARAQGDHGVHDVIQVRVLELENQLQKERQKLGELRKKHYELAGVAEGWEEDGEWIPVLLPVGSCTRKEWGRMGKPCLQSRQRAGVGSAPAGISGTQGQLAHVGKATGPLICAGGCGTRIAPGQCAPVLLGLCCPAKLWDPKGMGQRDAEGAPCCSTPPYPLSLLQLQINTRGGGSPRGTPPTAGCDPAQCSLLGRSTMNRCKSHPEAHVLRVPSAKSRLQRWSTKSRLARPRGREQGLAGLTPAANRTCIY